MENCCDNIILLNHCSVSLIVVHPHGLSNAQETLWTQKSNPDVLFRITVQTYYNMSLSFVVVAVIFIANDNTGLIEIIAEIWELITSTSKTSKSQSEDHTGCKQANRFAKFKGKGKESCQIYQSNH